MKILARYTHNNQISANDHEKKFRTDTGAVRYFSKQGIACEWQRIRNPYRGGTEYCLVRLGRRFQNYLELSRKLQKIACFHIIKDKIDKPNSAIYYPSSQKDFYDIKKKLDNMEIPYTTGVSYIEVYFYNRLVWI